MSSLVRLLALFLLTCPAFSSAWNVREINQLSKSLVVGTVISVEPLSGLIVVRQANLLGYLRFQVKPYRVKQPSSLRGLRPGDRITAVYSRKRRYASSSSAVFACPRVRKQATLQMRTGWRCPPPGGARIKLISPVLLVYHCRPRRPGSVEKRQGCCTRPVQSEQKPDWLSPASP